MKAVAISTSASGDTELLPAATGWKYQVHGYVFCVGGNVNVKFKSGSTDLTGAMPQTTGGGVSYAMIPAYEAEAFAFETASGEALNINLSAAVSVAGHLTYSKVPG